MTKILVSGCSYVHGTGLTDECNNVNHFFNVFTQQTFNDADVNNIGVEGHSNLRIFLDTCSELINNNYEYAFVCWTSYPRYVIWTGLETYETKRDFMPCSPINMVAHNGNDLSFDQKFLHDLRDKLSLVSNEHYDILDIVNYVNIIENLATFKQTKIFFINIICQWDSEYFTRVSTPLPTNLTNYTNKILNSDNRDDSEIFELYDKIHNDYRLRGTIKQHLWLNLYQSFKSLTIDYGTDNMHPGIKSHQLFGNYLAEIFNGQQLAPRH